MALITLRSRPCCCCSHRLRSGPVRFLGASPLGAPTTSSPTTRHLPQPHRPIEFFANNFFDCRHRGSLAASTQVNRAPRVRHPPSIFSTYAPRLERVLLTRGDGVLHIKISGSLPNLFCWLSVIPSRSISPHPPPTFSRTLRSVLAIIVARTRAIFSSSSPTSVSIQDNGSVSSASSTSSALYFTRRLVALPCGGERRAS